MTPTSVALTIQVLVPLFAVHAAWAVADAARPNALAGGTLRWAGFAYAALFLAACALALTPSGVAMRARLPLVQPAWIVSLIALALSLHALPVVRRLFTSLDLRPILALFGWRIVFGALLGLSWLTGGLPAAFAVPAALGDIATGLFGLVLLARIKAGKPTPASAFHVFNILGCLDLLNVMRLALVALVPFLTDRPELPQFPLLPLFGVPVFLALHLHIWRAFRHANSTGLTRPI
jgi:hypothetical protein